MSNVKLPDMDEHAQCQIIAPPKKLQKKAVMPSEGFSSGHNAIKRAERALEELSVNFADWMQADVNKLSEARDAARENGVNAETIEAVFIGAHDLRGQAATFGFPYAATLCASLCQLIEMMPDPSRIPQVIIDHHVDAVRAVVRQNIQEGQDKTANALVNKLRSVTQDFLDQEIKIAKTKQQGAA